MDQHSLLKQLWLFVVLLPIYAEMQVNPRFQILFPATVYSIRHLKFQRTLLKHETQMMRELGIIIFDIQKHLQSMHKTEKFVKMARMLEIFENILIRS